MDIKSLFTDSANRLQRSSVREILKLTAQPDMISFAGGLPAPELFPVERVQEAHQRIMQQRGREALQYSTSEGMPELRGLIADRLSSEKVTVAPENIVIINGSQQGLDLMCRLFLNDGDTMLLENPSYVGMLMAAKLHNLNYLPINTDENGMQVDELDNLLTQNPKMIYSIPNFQNPQGVTLSGERRKALIEKTYDKNLILLEDNPYGELRYSGEEQPYLMHIDAEQRGINHIEGNVVYIGTFSKVLMPGLRIGWIVAHPDIADKVVQFKQATDLHTGTLPQFLTYEVAKDGFMDEHISHLREAYRKRRDLMLDTMSEFFPEEVMWRKPDGGLFLMVYLPEHMDAYDLLQKAIPEKVAYVPGADFHLDGAGKNSFRLNYSNAKPDQIVAGIERLGLLIKRELTQHPVGK